MKRIVWKLPLGALAVAGIVIAFGLPAMADCKRHPGAMKGQSEWKGRLGILFAEMDADGDGVVIREEIETYQMAEFNAMDTDGDGMLSHEELSASMMGRQAKESSKKADRMIERLDSNDDGMLSMTEMDGRMKITARLMDKLDKDKDFALSMEEIDQGVKSRSDRHHRGRHRHRSNEMHSHGGKMDKDSR